MAIIAFIFGIVVLKYSFRVMVWVITAPFKLIEAASISLERSRKDRARRLAQIEKERARRIAADQRERLRIEQAARREQREQEQREQRRIKWEWAQEREQERKKAAAWRECCNKSKMGLDYQIAADNEQYRRVRGTELYSLLELYENELIAATEAGNLARIEKARKNLLNTRRLIRENEKAVYMDKYNKAKYKAYSSAAE